MNLFFVGYGFDPSSGGIERYSHTIASYLRDQGHGLFAWAPRMPSDRQGGPFHWLQSRRFIDRALLGARLARAMKQFHIDEILCTHLFWLPVVDAVAARTGVSVVLFVHGIECWAGRFAAIGSSANCLRKIGAVSSFTTRQIVEQGCDPGKIAYVPPVVALPSRPTNGSHKTGQGGEFTVLTVARMSAAERYKGHDVVIRAVARLKDSMPNLRYRVAGSGDDKPRLEALCAEVGVADRVDFLGFVADEDLPGLYAECDVFAMPSRVSLDPEKPEGEGFGIVFLEAALASRPLIGPNTGGSTDIIVNGENGFTVDPSDDLAVAEAILTLRENRTLCDRMGRAARRTVEDKFSLEQLPGYLDALFA